MDDSEPLPEVTEWRQLVAENQFYFKRHPRIKFTRTERIHSHGGRLTFTEYDREGYEVRKLTVKYAADQDGLELLENEILCLEHLRGSMHVVRSFTLRDSKINISGTGRHRRYPMVALEYLPFGSLGQLRERAARAGRYMPNRILWRVFLCLARQQLAFLFPPRGPPNGPLVQETMGTMWGHNGMGVIDHSGLNDAVNHRFREHDRGDPEHAMVPALVSTDFSRSRFKNEYEGVGDSIFYHMRAIGYLMVWFALNRTDTRTIENDTTRVKLTNSQVKRIFPEHEIAEQIIDTDVPLSLWKAEGIDFQLKELVGRCLAVDSENMPTPRNLALLCEDGVQYRAPELLGELPPDRAQELVPGQDGQFVRDFILNADATGELGLLGEQNAWGGWG